MSIGMIKALGGLFSLSASVGFGGLGLIRYIHERGNARGGGLVL